MYLLHLSLRRISGIQSFIANTEPIKTFQLKYAMELHFFVHNENISMFLEKFNHFIFNNKKS